MKLTIAVIGKNKQLLTKLTDQQTEHNEIITATTVQKAIQKAKGKYITFVYERDDIEPHYTEAIIKKIDDGEFDMCLFGWQYMNWHGYRHIGFVEPFKPIFCVIFKREMIADIKENIIEECWDRVGTVTNLYEILYSYRGERG